MRLKLTAAFIVLISTAVATVAIANLFKHEELWRDAPHDDGAVSAGTSTDVICYVIDDKR